MLRQARKNGITLDELFSTSYPSNKQTPAQKIISMYSERRGGSKYKPKRSRAPNRSKPRKRSKCAKFSKSMCNNNSKKTRGCVWRKNTGCVRKSRRSGRKSRKSRGLRSGRRSGRKSRKPRGRRSGRKSRKSRGRRSGRKGSKKRQYKNDSLKKVPFWRKCGIKNQCAQITHTTSGKESKCVDCLPNMKPNNGTASIIVKRNQK